MSGLTRDETHAWSRTLTHGSAGGYVLTVARAGRTGRPPARLGRLREGLHSSCGTGQHGRASPRWLLHWPSSRLDCRQVARSPSRRHSVALEQARSGEDGTSGAGANSGNTSTGNAERDKNGNGGNASAGEGGTTDTTAPEEAPLPENADLLAALGILDVVTAYDLDAVDWSRYPDCAAAATAGRCGSVGSQRHQYGRAGAVRRDVR